MNVFVLCTGRCGSTTFSRACAHISNYSSAHESRVHKMGSERLRYPDNHIEVDNRLAWFLGRLDRLYGDEAFYVHLKRDKQETALSYSRRFIPGKIMPAYTHGVYLFLKGKIRKKDVALDFYDTVTANIELFLRDKTQKMDFMLENSKEDFREFWKQIGAEGELDNALLEWNRKYYAGPVQP